MIIVHCSATPEGEDYTVEQIRAMHLQRGFTDIGYHYVIYRDGSVHRGRAESLSGAHTSGYNSRSIGVCYIGGCPARTDPKWMNKGKDTRTPQQKAALLKLLKELKGRYPSATVHGHREFAAKACPSFDARKEYTNI
ncbi:MAG: N-acetylmuramoyl-L-alanine amidase [bacterium]|nr:N-acetylmuramoyl-L-alanine amidase [bacterium]